MPTEIMQIYSIRQQQRILIHVNVDVLFIILVADTKQNLFIIININLARSVNYAGQSVFNKFENDWGEFDLDRSLS